MLERPYSLLIVDDEPDIIDLVENMLMENFENELSLLTATSGKEALQLIEKNEFQIIISDLYVPDYSGYDIAKQAWATNKSTRVIFLTGKIEESVYMTSYREGASAILFKPISSNQLINVIRNVIENLEHWNRVYDQEF